jgi:hypothetical protein
MNWKYFEPKFEYEEKFDDMTWPWAGHKYFAYDLIRNFKPKVIVELGTHKGTSFFSFCQAAKDGKFECELNAVDTWNGDKQAGFYDDSVWNDVNEIKKQYYPNLNTNLLRMTFDEAVKTFKDNTIDILHIDGLHTYEAVKHDFENWFEKVKNGGLILFHDIVEKHDDFGVYKLWDELKEKHKTIEFHHSHGLGVLFKKQNGFNFLGDFQEIFSKYYPLLYDKKLLEHNLLVNDPTAKAIIQQKDQEIQQKDQEIAFMKSSKFWKLRSKYISLKNKLGMK